MGWQVCVYVCVGGGVNHLMGLDNDVARSRQNI